ncbi:lysoplasmalogenase family protein, partial [Burkholderia sp.]|uniref:lysoplasmalogenase family protein n=1 Tax=Burkholderia sp. TaxID=36773 RepID=UPI003451B6FC|nr:lysoplasmalogenase [Burkholderia sp.]
QSKRGERAACARTRGPLVALGGLIFVASDTLTGVGRVLGGFAGIDDLIGSLDALAQVTIVAGVFHETAARSVSP